MTAGNPWDEYRAPETKDEDTSGPWAEFKPAGKPEPAATPDGPEPTGFFASAKRAFKRSLPETESLVHGATAAVTGLVGADKARDAALARYRKVQEEEVAPNQGNDTFLGSIRGEEGHSLRDWAGDTLGNFAGQAAQSAVAAGAGALAGGAVTAETGPGAVLGAGVGAVGGLVARGAVKKAIEKRVAEMVADGATEGAARALALRKLGAGTLAATGLNVAQETGIAYTGRAEDAEAAGEELDAGDSVRAIAAGVPAGLLDTAAEAVGLDRLLKGSSGASMARRVAGGAVAQAGVEGGTEAAQAVLERAGAARDLTSPEAITEYIENAAAGALGGGVLGGASGVARNDAEEASPAPAPVQEVPEASEPPGPVVRAATVAAGMEPTAVAPPVRIPDAPITTAANIALDTGAVGALEAAAAVPPPVDPADPTALWAAADDAARKAFLLESGWKNPATGELSTIGAELALADFDKLPKGVQTRFAKTFIAAEAAPTTEPDNVPESPERAAVEPLGPGGEQAAAGALPAAAAQGAGAAVDPAADAKPEVAQPGEAAHPATAYQRPESQRAPAAPATAPSPAAATESRSPSPEASPGTPRAPAADPAAAAPQPATRQPGSSPAPESGTGTPAREGSPAPSASPVAPASPASKTAPAGAATAVTPSSSSAPAAAAPQGRPKVPPEVPRVMRKPDAVGYLRKQGGMTEAQALAAFNAIDRKGLKEQTRLGADVHAAAIAHRDNPNPYNRDLAQSDLPGWGDPRGNLSQAAVLGAANEGRVNTKDQFSSGWKWLLRNGLAKEGKGGRVALTAKGTDELLRIRGEIDGKGQVAKGTIRHVAQNGDRDNLVTVEITEDYDGNGKVKVRTLGTAGQAFEVDAKDVVDLFNAPPKEKKASAEKAGNQAPKRANDEEKGNEGQQGQVPAEGRGRKEGKRTEAGKQEPGDPGRGAAVQGKKRLLSEGERVTSTTGRALAPFPKVDATTDRKTGNTVKRVDAWLHSEALLEAQARGDDFAHGQFKGMKPDKLTQSDKASLNEYLFDNEDGPADFETNHYGDPFGPGPDRIEPEGGGSFQTYEEMWARIEALGFQRGDYNPMRTLDGYVALKGDGELYGETKYEMTDAMRDDWRKGSVYGYIGIYTVEGGYLATASINYSMGGGGGAVGDPTTTKVATAKNALESLRKSLVNLMTKERDVSAKDKAGAKSVLAKVEKALDDVPAFVKELKAERKVPLSERLANMDREDTEAAQAKKPAKGKGIVVGTAPEHVLDPDDVGVTVAELKEMSKEMRAYIDEGKAAGVTRVFDAPKPEDIVRLEELAEVHATIEETEITVRGKKEKRRMKIWHREKGWMDVDAAKRKILEWENHAHQQGGRASVSNGNAQRVVISLFDLSGEWARPWAEAGYQVYTFDIQNGETYEHEDPETGEIEERNAGDINNLDYDYFVDMYGMFESNEVYAILSANPCTDFTNAGAGHFAAKDASGQTVASVRLLERTMAIIEYFKPPVWALENPTGRIDDFGGLPPWRLGFDPFMLGDPYTKRTYLWGRFNGRLPVAPVSPNLADGGEGMKIWRKFGGKSQATKNARSETPEGFSYAFFMANNAIDNPLLAVAGKYDRLDRGIIEQALNAGMTESDIDDVVKDFYYFDLDDDAANEALQAEAVRVAELNPVVAAANAAATSKTNGRALPTEAQKEAGNYAKGHLAVNGLDVTIENPAGSKRREEWPPLAHAYGYIKRTVGADSTDEKLEQVDVFLSPRALEAELPVYVVNQYVKGKFDEHKVMLGFHSEAAARKGYNDNYTKGWKGLNSITRLSMAEFKEWLANGDTKAELRLQPEMFVRGRGVGNAQAVRFNDGTWAVRHKKSGQWQPWRDVEAFEASPAFGYRKFMPPSGQVKVDGGVLVLGPPQEPDAPPAPKGPPALLEVLAKAGGLSREHFQKEGVDPAQFKTQFGVGKWLFPKSGGMNGDALREWMQQRGYLQAAAEGEETVDDNDALDLVMRALGGERIHAVYNSDEVEAVAAFADEARYDSETADVGGFLDELEVEAGVSIEPGDEAEALEIAQLAARLVDAGMPKADVEIELTWMEGRPHGQKAGELLELIRQQENRNAERQGQDPAGEGRAAPAAAGQEGPSFTLEAQSPPQEVAARPRAQTDLFAPATTAEAVEAARRAKQDQLDGRTGTGRTDMLGGAGTLFAGAAPAQVELTTSDMTTEPTELERMQKLLEDYNYGDNGVESVEDLANAIEEHSTDADLLAAAQAWQEERREDLDEFGGRGDSDEYDQELLSALESYLSKATSGDAQRSPDGSVWLYTDTTRIYGTDRPRVRAVVDVPGHKFDGRKVGGGWDMDVKEATRKTAHLAQYGIKLAIKDGRVDPNDPKVKGALEWLEKVQLANGKQPDPPKGGKKPPKAPKPTENTIFTKGAADAARERIRAKLGRLNSGIDPELLQDGIILAGYHIERGARTFAAFAGAMIADLGEGVRPYLKSWYAAVKLDPRARDLNGLNTLAEVESADENAAYSAPEEDAHVPDPDVGVESNRGDAAAQASAVEAPVRAGRSGAARGARGARGRAGRGRARDQVVPADGPPAHGERGDQSLLAGNRAEQPSLLPAGADLDSRGGGFGDRGVPVEREPAKAPAGAAAEGVQRADDRVAVQRQANLVPVAPGAANIAESLPYLLEGQREDVLTAETRFAKRDGYGMLFTNGTGTGKTFTGLGIAARSARAGKDRILFVAPSDKIIEDWTDSGQVLGLNLSRLESTSDAGAGGPTVTTYANFANNRVLADREWDLVVLDEAHYLSQGKDGEDSLALASLRAITLHPDGTGTRARMLHRDLYDRQEALNKELKGLKVAQDMTDAQVSQVLGREKEIKAELEQLRKQIDEAYKAVSEDVKARQGAARPRALFLSATPFAYEKSVEWAQGYLFEYDKLEARGYNQPNGRQAFFMQHFGYRMRVGKLTEPDHRVDRGLLQRQFNSFLKKTGVAAGRMLDVPSDYDRRFVLVDSAIGRDIDAALQWLSDKQRDAAKNISAATKADPQAARENGYGMLEGLVSDSFDYLSRRYLLEAIKATEVLPHVRAHLAKDRKVVVFHDYKKGGGFNPFDVHERHETLNTQAADLERAAGRQPSAELAELERKDRRELEAFNAAVRDFRAAHARLVNSPLGTLPSPIQVFQREFPGVLLFNGDVSPKNRRANVAAFNRDEGPAVMLVQSAAGKEGISLHDTSGKFQRVLFNLGQPTAPTTAIQQEGRIRRVGQASNAIFRYLNTGTNWERWTFATTIANRASTAENLALGEQARALKDAFIAAFEESGDYPAGHEGEGVGGKERDAAAQAALSAFDRARAFYFGTEKKNSRTKAQEGKDYFATPEPLGLKMVEWADVRSGEDVLEPSAGHGAIARWFPELANRHAIEPSDTLSSRLAMVFDGKVERDTFENLHVVNKYDAIVMNPPFGTAGKTAMDHIAKAVTHLRDGGRIVALIPDGPAMGKRFDKFMYETETRPAKPIANSPAGPIYLGDMVSTKGWGDGEGESFRVEHVSGPMSGPQFVRPAGRPPEYGVNTVAIQKVTPGERTEKYSPAKDLYLVADIKLPRVTFERAGTEIAARIVVLEKPFRGVATAQQVNRDFSDAESIGDFFKAIEYSSIPGRSKPEVDEAPAPKPVAAPVVQTDPSGANPDWTTHRLEGERDVLHTTQKGKNLLGIVRMGISREEAKALDAFTFQKDGGWFIRAKHVGPKPQFSRAPQAIRRGMDPVDVRAVVTGLTAGWNRQRAPLVLVVASAEEYPASVKAEDGYRTTQGVYINGTVYLNAAMMRDPRDVQTILAHEVIGHHGIESITGPKLWAELDTTVAAMQANPKYSELFAELERRYGNAGGNRATFIREAIAVMAEKGMRNSVLDRVLVAIRKFLRELGLKVQFSDKELLEHIADSANYIASAGNPVGVPQAAAFANDAPVFTSALVEAVVAGKGAPKNADAEAWLGWLDGAVRRGEFKQTERDWLGVDDWLHRQPGKVSRDQLAAFVRGAQLQTKDVLLASTVRDDYDADGVELKATSDEYVDAEVDEDGDEGQERIREVTYEEEFTGWSFTVRYDEDAGNVYITKDDGTDIIDNAPLNRQNLETAQRAIRDHLTKELGTEANAEEGAAGPTQYGEGDLQTPGGSEYRELLVTVPNLNARKYIPLAELPPGWDSVRDDHAPAWHRWSVTPPGAMSARPYGDVRKSSEAEARKAVLDLLNWQRAQATKDNSPAFESPHFTVAGEYDGVRNPIVHIRFNTRKLSTGEPMLFLEEVQSELHQLARKRAKKGAPTYRTQFDLDHVDALMEQYNRLMAQASRATHDWEIEFAGKPPSALSIEDLTRANRLLAAATNYRNRAEGMKDNIRDLGSMASEAVPDAPFKASKDWGLLGVRRAIRWAAERDIPYVGWTNGTMQADRYNLVRVVDRLQLADADEGFVAVTGYKGDRVVIQRDVKDDGVADFIGEELAARYFERRETAEYKGSTRLVTLDTGDMKIGGTGMVGFYDKILPAAVNDWAKKFGARVRMEKLSDGIRFEVRQVPKGWAVFNVGENRATSNVFDSKEKAEAYRAMGRANTDDVYVPVLEITPAMKAAALAGMPMFNRNRRFEVREDEAEFGTTSPLNSDRNAARARAAHAAVKQATNDPQLDLFAPQEKKNPQAMAEGIYEKAKLSNSVRNVQFGTFKTAVETVKDWTDAANIIAPIRKLAQEYFMAVAVDGAGKPLAVLRHTIGTIDGSQLEPMSLVGALAAVPGIRSVYLAHNHPSGNLNHSNADKTVSAKIQRILAGTGIDVKGMIVVANGQKEATWWDGKDHDGLEGWAHPIAKGQRNKDVPIIERAVRRHGAKGPALKDPNDAAYYVNYKLVPDGVKSGVLLLNTKHEVVGVLPMTAEEMAKLRTGDASTGAAAMFRAVAEANTAAVMLFGPDEAAIDNAATALKAIDVRVLDAFVPRHGVAELKSKAERGNPIGTHNGLWFSRFDPTNSPAFKRWFKDSKVVGAGDKPRVVYHGTGDDFAAFSAERSGESTNHLTTGLGFFFANDRKKAEAYAERASQGVPMYARVIDAYLSLQKPYRTTFTELLKLDSVDQVKAFRAKLEASGHDGLQLTDIGQWVAFKPEQVKHAHDNAGSFDAGNPNMYFSRPDLVGGEATAGTINLSPAARKGVKSAIGAKLTDMKPLLLGAIPLNYLSDYAHKDMPAVKSYIEQRNQLEAFRNKLHKQMDDIAQRWIRFGATARGPLGLLGSKVNAGGRTLSDLMHDSTIVGVDPSTDGRQYAADPVRRAEYRELRERFDSLGPVGQQLYIDARNAYSSQVKLLEETLEANFMRALQIRRSQLERELDAELKEIDDEGGPADQVTAKRAKAIERNEAKAENVMASAAARVIALKAKMESMRVDAPYFPLKRFGKYFVAARDRTGKLVSFSKFEGSGEANAFAQQLAARGLTVNVGHDSEKEAIQGALDPRFIADVDDILSEAGGGNEVVEQIRDAIYQRYLESLPDMSLRKSFIHRKKVPGYHVDALRSFSSVMFHGSYQLARLKYGMEMGETLDVADDQARKVDPVEGVKLVNELRRRHQWVMNPTGSVAGQVATSAAFVWHLGANPAHLFLNATQTVMLGVPILGSKYGFVKVAKQLARAVRDFAGGGGHIEKTLSGDERAAMQAALDSGLIDKTQAHDLAGVGETGVEYSANRQKVMAKLSWFFHQSERFNREVTFMAAYRLARADGAGHEAAIARASDHTWQIHFDYSSGNRPRYMQSDAAKVLLVFRNYNVNILYRLFRDIHTAFRGESREVRKEAQRQLGAMFGMYSLMAGVTGVPLYGLAMALAGMFDDDDEPFDAEERFRQGTVELLGEDAAAYLLKGVPGTALGIDISQRIGMPNLWFRSPDRELEGRDAYYYWMEQLLGAVPGIAKNVFTGLQQIHNGNLERGVETMLPNMVKSPVRAARYAEEGALSLDGDKVTDVDGGGVLAQLLGFTPAEVAEQYDRNSALKGAEAKLQARRRMLMNRYTLALTQRDEELQRETMAKIQAFNRSNPAFAVTGDSLKRSLGARQRNRVLSAGGIVMSRRLRALEARREAAEQ